MIRESKSMSTILTPMNASSGSGNLFEGPTTMTPRASSSKPSQFIPSINKTTRSSPLGQNNMKNQMPTSSRSLKDLSLKEQEAWIIEDLLYVLIVIFI